MAAAAAAEARATVTPRHRRQCRRRRPQRAPLPRARWMCPSPAKRPSTCRCPPPFRYRRPCRCRPLWRAWLARHRLGAIPRHENGAALRFEAAAAAAAAPWTNAMTCILPPRAPRLVAVWTPGHRPHGTAPPVLTRRRAVGAPPREWPFPSGERVVPEAVHPRACPLRCSCRRHALPAAAEARGRTAPLAACRFLHPTILAVCRHRPFRPPYCRRPMGGRTWLRPWRHLGRRAAASRSRRPRPPCTLLRPPRRKR